jgi:hypothetical protein
MPHHVHDGLHRGWNGLRKQIARNGRERSVTVTFNYGGSLRTVVAPSYRAAVLDAVARWGNDYTGNPCVSSPDTIYNDLTGWTKRNHGQDFGVDMHSAMRERRRLPRKRASA